MSRPPRDPAKPLFDARMAGTSLLAGMAVLLPVCALYGWALAHGRGEGEARALAFAAIVIGNLALIFLHRGGGTLSGTFVTSMFTRSNPMLWWVVLGTLGALGGAMYLAPVAALFQLVPLTAGDLLLSCLTGVCGIAAILLFRRAAHTK